MTRDVRGEAELGEGRLVVLDGEPRSEPATNAPYTELGSRFLARRWATATVSNQAFFDIEFSLSHNRLTCGRVMNERDDGQLERAQK